MMTMTSTDRRLRRGGLKPSNASSDQNRQDATCSPQAAGSLHEPPFIDATMATTLRFKNRDHQDLAFNEPDGPVVAFVALCGGSGASTLTYLTAAAAARDSSLPVIAVDGDSNNGGLAYYSGAEGPYSLGDYVSLDVDPDVQHQLQQPLYDEAAFGARIMARPPHGALPSLPAAHLRAADAAQPGGPIHESVANLLSQCRASHGLTVIDCGTLARPEARAALDCATHIVWLLPATRSGARRAKLVLDSLTAFLPGQEIVCARRDGERKAPTDELRALAGERLGPLVLMPHIPDLASHPLEEALERAETALHALAVTLRR